MHRIGLAVAVSALMLVSIVAFMALVQPGSIVAAELFAPYALWVAFATALTTAIWRLNRTGAPRTHRVRATAR
ncbi:MAG: TspO/MBR family protein [Betaproteobacteria bacterium]